MRYRSSTEMLKDRMHAIIKRSRAVSVFVFVLVALSMHGAAQATQGSMFGTAKDAGGAVISGATVTLTNTDEGTTREALTNTTGDYLFSNVKAGIVFPLVVELRHPGVSLLLSLCLFECTVTENIWPRQRDQRTRP